MERQPDYGNDSYPNHHKDRLEFVISTFSAEGIN